MDFDVIVVGSGFGGAVTAARLADAGYRVLVLERGRWWTPETFPRELDDPWVFDVKDPARRNGWFDFRVFEHMTVVQGAGVGGGSLVYANVSVDAKEDTFNSGWPAEITFGGLAGHYARVKAMLASEPVPDEQWPERTRLLRDAAVRAGYGDKFRTLDLAVTFDHDWRYGAGAHDLSRSMLRVNAQGVEQGTCVHLGTCDIGCRAKARNTLDFNYLALATQKGAEIRALHLVVSVAPVSGGYRVDFERLEHGQRLPGQATARLVILAAGSLGSTEILLRARARGDLSQLSDRLGKGWSSNGDFLTPALHLLRNVDPTRGPTITAAIDLLEGEFRGQAMFIEDGGFPDATIDWLARTAGEVPGTEREAVLIATVQVLTRLDAFRHIMPWFAQSRDAADGTLALKDGRLWLDWEVAASEPTIDAVVAMHERLARLTGGMALVPPTWTLSKDLITPHPLGGANMGTTPATGVVDFRGEVFGHPNLFVADGAIVPKAIGRNPSKTIAALAEHIAERIVTEGR